MITLYRASRCITVTRYIINAPYINFKCDKPARKKFHVSNTVSNTVRAEIGQFESGDSQAQQIKYGKIVRSGSFVFHSHIHMYFHIHKYI